MNKKDPKRLLKGDAGKMTLSKASADGLKQNSSILHQNSSIL